MRLGCTASLRFVRAALFSLSYRALVNRASLNAGCAGSRCARLSALRASVRPRNLPGKSRVLCLLSYRFVGGVNNRIRTGIGHDHSVELCD